MNLYNACIRLGIWSMAKARAEVWSMSNNRTVHEESLSELRDLSRRSYRKLAMDHHPDRGGDRDNFIEIQSASELVKDATVRDFVDALDDEQRSSMVYFDPGSEACKKCSRWSDVISSCITATCSGFKEPRRKKFANIRGKTQFAAILDTAYPAFVQ